MKKPPYIKLFIKDFAFDIQGMSNEEIGELINNFIKAYKSGNIPGEYKDMSIFEALEKAEIEYVKVCERNKANRLKSIGCADKSSTGGGQAVDVPLTTLVNQNQEPKPEPKPNKDNILYFYEFWEHYPRQRRGNKQNALKAYKRVLKEDRATEEQIRYGLNQYRQSQEVANGYAKGAEAWLNADGWANDYRSPTQKKDDYFTGQMRAAKKAMGEQI